MTGLHNLILASSSFHGGASFYGGSSFYDGSCFYIGTAIAAGVPSGYSLLTLLAALIVILTAGSWMLLAIGVRIGRSMERHAALALLIESKSAEPPPAIEVPLLDPLTGLLSAPELHPQMVRDTLTGLWTREAILDQLRREMSRATRQGVPLGLVMVKLDYFDQLKRDSGDAVSEAVLQRAAEHFVEGLREYDTAGRSGAEFLLVLPGWDPESNPRRVDGMLAPIQMKPGVGHENLQITASIGVASFHPSADSPYAEDLLQRADMAVHAAQAAGRNRAEFAPR